jgi:transcriptional regulator with XRE-family HTH domain
MTITGRGIVERIDGSGKNRKEVAAVAGLKSVQSFTDWSKGSIPSADTVLKIADFLKVSYRWLLTGEDEKGLTLTPEQRKLIAKYEVLDKQGQRMMFEMLDLLLKEHGASLDKKEASGTPPEIKSRKKLPKTG